MKIGDLVKHKWGTIYGLGIVIERGIYAGNKDIKALWEDGRVLTCKSYFMELISESR